MNCNHAHLRSFRPHALRNPTCPATTQPRKPVPAGVANAYYIDTHGVKQDTAAWYEAALQARRLLRAVGFTLGGELGHGRYGAAYELENEPGFVCKITGDWTEALAWTRVLAHKRLASLPALAQVDCVFELPVRVSILHGRRMFAIVQEKLEPLSLDGQNYFNEYGWLLRTAAQGTQVEMAREYMLGDTEDDDEAFEIAAEPQAGIMERAGNYFVGTGAEWADDFSYHNLANVVKTVIALRLDGIKIIDLHGGNLLYSEKGHAVKITDLGVAEVAEALVKRLKVRR